MPIVPGPGAEFADFGNRDLLFGLTSDEAWVNLTKEDLQVSGIRNRYAHSEKNRVKENTKYINYTVVSFLFGSLVFLANFSITVPCFRDIFVSRIKSFELF